MIDLIQLQFLDMECKICFNLKVTNIKSRSNGDEISKGPKKLEKRKINNAIDLLNCTRGKFLHDDIPEAFEKT